MKKALCILMSALFLALSLPFSALAEDAGGNNMPKSYGLPIVSITMEDSPSSITKEDSFPASFSLFTGDKDEIIDAEITIKGRGNSTWSAPKKPYQIKFESKTNVFSMGKAKKWVLLANYYDQTLMKNYLATGFAAKLGLDYTPQMKFVDLYINGEYYGNYTLGEKVESGSSRIDISDGGVILEVNARLDENYNFTTSNHVPFSIKEPEYDLITDDMSDEEKQEINDFVSGMQNEIQSIETLIYAHDSKCFDYIDLDSFVDWYIVNELYKNIDANFKGSCYMYKNPGEKFYMGPVWDFDLSLGNTLGGANDNLFIDPEGFHVSSQRWYGQLRHIPEFEQALRVRWFQLRKDGTIDSFFAEVDAANELISDSANANQKLWSFIQFKDLYGDTIYNRDMAIDYMKGFYARRVVWMDGMLSNDPDKIADAVTLINGLPEKQLVISSERYINTVNSFIDALTDEEKAQIDSSLLAKLSSVNEQYTAVDKAQGLKSVTISSQTVHKNDPITFTCLTSPDVSKIAVMAENGKALGKTNETITITEDGSKQFTFGCTFGSVGLRTVTINALGGNDEYEPIQYKIAIFHENQLLPDNSELKELVNRADSIDLSDKTDESSAAFATALEEAKLILADPSNTQTDINRALLNLSNAINALQIDFDKIFGLKSVTLTSRTVYRNEPITFTCITSSDVNKIAVLTETGKALGKISETISLLDDGNKKFSFACSFGSIGSRNIIVKAMGGNEEYKTAQYKIAVLSEFQAIPNKANLSALVDEADTINISDKSDSSVTVFTAALENAKSVLDDPAVMQYEINDAVTELRKAMDLLVVDADKTPGLKSVLLSSQTVKRNEPITFTCITSRDVAKVAVYTENSKVLGKLSETVTVLDNGNKVFTFTCSFGTQGTRNITVKAMGGFKEYEPAEYKITVQK